MRVADIESLERCVAAALRGHLVEVHLVAEEALEAAPPEPEREMPAASLEEGWTLRSRGATQLELLMAPGTAVCTRDTELCCWPKVWEFAQMLAKGEAHSASLGTRTPALWRGPTSKSRLKRARAAAAALAAARQPGAAPEDAARAAKAVEAALHKAPQECEAVGVDRAALSGLLRHARGQPN
eukprot:jgi/Tetstr1/463527/TSEL_008406.t1